METLPRTCGTTASLHSRPSTSTIAAWYLALCPSSNSSTIDKPAVLAMKRWLHQVLLQLPLRSTGDNSDTSHSPIASTLSPVSRTLPTSMPILPTGHISLPPSAPKSHLRSPTRCWSANVKEYSDKVVALVTSATSTNGSHFIGIRSVHPGTRFFIVKHEVFNSQFLAPLTTRSLWTSRPTRPSSLNAKRLLVARSLVCRGQGRGMRDLQQYRVTFTPPTSPVTCNRDRSDRPFRLRHNTEIQVAPAPHCAQDWSLA